MTAKAVPGIAVVICAYTDRRWDDLVAAYRSVLGQTPVADEVVVVIDHNPELMRRFADSFPEAKVVANDRPAGLSGARNTGIAVTVSDVVLFLDDDARADAGWISALTAPFADPSVQGVAGWAEPAWGDAGQPGWFPDPFLWVVGCSYQGLPTTVSDVRNPLGCAMGFRRSAIESVGGFSGSVGRVGTHPVGCEETEFSIRLRQLDPSARIVMVPQAVVHHRVSDDRRSVGYYLRRCYWEGVSKAVVSAAVGTEDGLESERAYATRVLPAAVLNGLGDTLRGRLSGLGRAVAVVAGLAATSLGFVRGRLSGTTTTERPAAPVRIRTRPTVDADTGVDAETRVDAA
jgi:hypothetical protein